MSSVITPDKICEILSRIATSVESSDSPDRYLASIQLRLLLASVEEDLILVFNADPTVEYNNPNADIESIKKSVEMELMEAGAKSVDWDSDSIYVVAPPGSNVSVLEAFDDMQYGEAGDDIKGFTDLFKLTPTGPQENPVAAKLARVASRIARRKKRIKPPPRVSKPIVTQDMLVPSTEYSCQVDMNLTADFEGAVSKQKLLKKLRTELIASIKAGVSTTALEFGLEATGIHVKPIRVECAVNSEMSPEDEIEPEVPVEEPEDEEPDIFEQAKPSRSKKKRR